jgi:hypothetical protein
MHHIAMLLNKHVSIVTREKMGEYLASRLPLKPNEVVTIPEIIEHFECDDSPDSRNVLKRLIFSHDWDARVYDHEGRKILAYRPIGEPLTPEANKAKFEDHPWRKSIRAFLEEHPEVKAVTTAMIVANRTACPDAQGTHADAIIAGNVVRLLGWEKRRHHDGKRGTTVYVRPVAAGEVVGVVGAIGV